ncbi:hypothetical protein [Candidatus Protochlamydia phocaeensis]|uniref:hypothetical protein n=1 Tax=Candidatus Protochlamydia phocaeensis TaxID=1414722 RepID=UPI0008399855|nr:hypothetical protein [Candidatus Protochlamydia phocaeensis]
MEKKINFTNEMLAKKFKSNFELVNYAISLAENMIKSGRDARVKSEVQNRAMLILEEIQEGKDQFDEIKEVSSRRTSQDHEGEFHSEVVHEERSEKRRYRAAAIPDDEE